MAAGLIRAVAVGTTVGALAACGGGMPREGSWEVVGHFDPVTDTLPDEQLTEDNVLGAVFDIQRFSEFGTEIVVTPRDPRFVFPPSLFGEPPLWQNETTEAASIATVDGSCGVERFVSVMLEPLIGGEAEERYILDVQEDWVSGAVCTAGPRVRRLQMEIQPRAVLDR
jgi:hypothetical protein